MSRLLQRFLIASLLTAMFLTIAGSAIADPSQNNAAAAFDDALAARKRGDYATAYKLFRLLADQGHAQAQGFLGLAYVDGNGVPIDYSQALGAFIDRPWLCQPACMVTDLSGRVGGEGGR